MTQKLTRKDRFSIWMTDTKLGNLFGMFHWLVLFGGVLGLYFGFSWACGPSEYTFE